MKHRSTMYLRRTTAVGIACVMAVGGAMFVDVESDIVKIGISQVVGRAPSGTDFWDKLKPFAVIVSAAICVFVVPGFLEKWGTRFLGNQEHSTRLVRFALVAALILSGIWRPAIESLSSASP